eukprot:m51a1_g14680 hypothetical protein (566) ;mRNA; f:69920-73695
MAFRWQQTPSTLLVSFPGPASRSRDDIDIALTPASIRAGIKGFLPSCEGAFYAQVKPQTARFGFKYATVAGGETFPNIVVAVEKAQAAVWPSVFGGASAGPAELKRMRALYDYAATEPHELSMKEGDTLVVVTENPSGWWQGELNGVVGTFPSNFTEQVSSEDNQASFDFDDGGVTLLQYQQQQQAAQAAQQAPAQAEEAASEAAAIPELVLQPGQTAKVRASFTYDAQDAGELSFKEGQVVNVIHQTTLSDSGHSAEAVAPVAGHQPQAVAPAPQSQLWPKFLGEFPKFCEDLLSAFNNHAAKAGVAQDNTALAVCTLDGVVAAFNGAANRAFVAQGVMWPLLYSMCCEEGHEAALSKHVGKERKSFDRSAPKAQNALCPAGAIAMCSLLASSQSDPIKRISTIVTKASALADTDLGCSMPYYMTCARGSDADFAAAYAMKTSDNLPDAGSAGVREVMDLYFQVNSVLMTVRSAATYAASLANDGTGVSSGKKSTTCAPKAITHMSLCGIAHDLQQKVPSTSGSGGLAIVAVPKVFGIAVYAPPETTLASDFVRFVAATYKLKA